MDIMEMIEEVAAAVADGTPSEAAWGCGYICAWYCYAPNGGELAHFAMRGSWRWPSYERPDMYERDHSERMAKLHQRRKGIDQ